MSEIKYYSQADAFYGDLCLAIQQAEEHIHAAYFAIDAGHWASVITNCLLERANAGVKVYLMVDRFGNYLENIRNSYRNEALLAELVSHGVQVVRFDPQGARLGYRNRLHCKFCAIDDKVAFTGGSNIGDHYPGWVDQNVRLTGRLGDGFRRLFTYLEGVHAGRIQAADVSSLLDTRVGAHQMHLTIPGHRYDIRRQLLELILSSQRSLYLRSWYFWPDEEVAQALQTQAERGVNVHIMFSHRTRVRPVDWLNRPVTRRLLASGARLYRYDASYMHAKATWNDNGQILFGSANIDPWALKRNFECCLQIADAALAGQLTQTFWQDTRLSRVLAPLPDTGMAVLA
ncbi:MAG: hypothetical protein KDE34_13330 [Anaerolineales bacterium]|nr:hypothetical protein [Anaerolineales bacterium]